jgi:hypothetical protein
VRSAFCRAHLQNEGPYVFYNKINPVALVCKQTLPTERHPLVGTFECQLLRIEGCRVVSVMGSHCCYSRFSRVESLFVIHVALSCPHKAERNPIPDILLLTTFRSAWNRTRDLWVCSQELRTLDHRGACVVTEPYTCCFGLLHLRMQLLHCCCLPIVATCAL